MAGPRWLTHMAGKLAVAAGGIPQFLFMWSLPGDCLNVMAWCGFPQSEKSKKVEVSLSFMT